MRFILGVLCIAITGAVFAQTIPVANPSFETGTNAPDGWTLSGGAGKWLDDGIDGKRAVAVSGTGSDSNFWLSDPLPLEPNSVYLLRFFARDLGSADSTGTPIAGPVFCNRDLGAIPKEWTEYTSVFVTPAEITPDAARLRFGQWWRKSAVAFDNIRLMRAEPVYAHSGDFTIGDGESIHGNQYECKAPYYSSQSNHSRWLVSSKCQFNTYRWAFGPKAEVVFKHEVGGRQQTAASVEPTITYYEGGEMIVEAGIDGAQWQEIGRLHDKTGKRFDIPSGLLPAKAVWIRLRAGDAASLQVSEYAYYATLDCSAGILPATSKPATPQKSRQDACATIEGSTRYVAVPQADTRLAVHIENVGDGIPGGNNTLTASVENKTDKPIPATPTLTFDPPTIKGATFATDTVLAPGKNKIEVPYTAPNPGTTSVKFSLGAGIDYQAETSMRVASLYDASFGERLAESNKDLTLWRASSGWKISQNRPAPDKTANLIDLSAAANETEAAQLVLRPEQPIKSLLVKPNALEGPPGHPSIPPESVEVLRVGYVPVARPSDGIGVAAPWPDPLLPLNDTLDLPAAINTILWIRVHVPAGTPAGAYTGDIMLATPERTVRVPLRVRVYGFELPNRMTCTTAFGFDPATVFRYQKLTDPAQQRGVIDRYFHDFSAHHISPYNWTPFDEIKVTWPVEQGKDIAPELFVPKIDWTAWDTAMAHAYDAYHFNSFVVSIPGMGGGTYQSRTEPSLCGYGETTPQYKTGFTAYCRALQEHLREKGWLNDAYVYWFDEPDTRDYPFVLNGCKRLKDAAPDIHRMLTKHIEPGLVGGPDIWCPLTPNYKKEDCEAHQKLGERIWWYVCCGPKEPYCGLFIDHPAPELRVWLWQTWQRHVEGILVWQANYWTSGSAYPNAAHPQNPYADPMGWVTDGSLAPGTHAIWGNGDGRFIYPPEAAADAHPEFPILDGPVDSIRWEMLRDGIEDYEYFVILNRLLKEKKDKLTPELLAEYTALLEAPPTVTTDMTHFTKDPKPIEERRDTIARAIEKLTLLNSVLW